jgi:hypothetical protein
MARHIATVAMLLIVQGAFDLVIGLALVGVALFVRQGDTAALAARLPLEPQAAVIVFAPLFAASGVLKIVAGARNYNYRSRLLGILALASCAVSMANCYCAPASLAVLVFGLVVYRHPDSGRAFVMGAQGLSREWIEASVGRGPGPFRR